jgi:hypothetical protein
MKTCYWAFCALGVSLSAQTAPQEPKPVPTAPPAQTSTQTPTQAPAQAPSGGQATSVTVDPKPPAYVRRFSAGATLEYLPLSLVQGGQVQLTQALGPIEINSDSKAFNPKSFGGGIVLQFALSDRWALAVNGLWRQTGYEMTNYVYTGANRKETITTEKTTVTFYDFPVLVRRYNFERTEPGWRWFYEAGGTFRYLNKINTSIEKTENGETTCCDSGPARLSSKNLPGVTGGIGLQFNDDFGIRIVPEVRYTWWLGRTFDNLATRSRRHQVDVMVSFTF